MNKRPYKYLTNAYVEWLGLEPRAIWNPARAVSVFVSENAAKPETLVPIMLRVVELGGRLYAQQEDELSWDLHE